MAIGLAGIVLTLPDTLLTLILGLTLLTAGMFSGVTAAQLGLSAVAQVDRGVATALYFTAYYLAGALAGFVPGLAWQAWRWPGVAALAGGVLALGLLAVLAGPRTRPQPTPR